MAEDLQGLLERIHQEGVARAEAEAARILAAARERAAALQQEAETRARTTLAEAERASQEFVERGRRALEQAARDVILSVEQAVQALFNALVAARVAEVLQPQVMQEMLVKVVEAYCRQPESGGRLELLVPPAEQEKLVGYLLQEFRELLKKGVTVRGAEEVTDGFRVVMADGRIQHDFTARAIAEALCRLVRPRLAELVRAAVGAGAPAAAQSDLEEPRRQ